MIDRKDVESMSVRRLIDVEFDVDSMSFQLLFLIVKKPKFGQMKRITYRLIGNRIFVAFRGLSLSVSYVVAWLMGAYITIAIDYPDACRAEC